MTHREKKHSARALWQSCGPVALALMGGGAQAQLVN